MADKATITDIKKLRPDLLEKSDAELERLATEIAMAQAERRRQAEIREKEALAAEAADHVEKVVTGIKFLHEHGLLPQRVTDGFSRGDGVFVPGMILRTPTAESLVPRAPGDRPRRVRRSKAEIEAARASGDSARRRRT